MIIGHFRQIFYCITVFFFYVEQISNRTLPSAMHHSQFNKRVWSDITRKPDTSGLMQVYLPYPLGQRHRRVVHVVQDCIRQTAQKSNVMYKIFWLYVQCYPSCQKTLLYTRVPDCTVLARLPQKRTINNSNNICKDPIPMDAYAREEN